ncbi:hook microtubule tethering protein isoform X2 [Arctopsyche grandis]|uniref:hook microtubule tethering protein isoform X2 n=1 Tax=Arctopsyche grandis TaxID=121162 RepID=UPI00406D902D
MEAPLHVSLTQWLNTLDLKAASVDNEISDGVLMAEALTQIAPDFFTPNWNSKIKADVGSNWRLKVSNLKKIVERIIDYYQDVLSLSLVEFPKPDVNKIAEKGDIDELGRLLQLILGCAVNCDQKEEYIRRIMQLEISCQRSIMQAIQELESSIHNRNRSSISLELGGNAARFQSELEAKAQRCHELDLQVRVLMEEKMTLSSENQKLQSKLQEGSYYISESVDDCGESIGPALSGTVRYNDMRRQVDSLKDELFKIETARDDYKAKTIMQEKEIISLYAKIEELQIAASESAQLKDEVDALRESADRMSNYEATIESFKKKMEDYVDLKKQVKILEQKNVEYVQRSIEHEEDAKKCTVLKSQLEIYKKQVSDSHEKLDAEITKADKLEIENKKIATKASALQREKDSLLQERDTLKETCEELRCSTLQTGNSEDSVSRELMPADIKERLIRLEHENKILRQNQGNQGDHASVQALLEDYAQRLEKQRNINREANQKIMQLEASIEESKTAGEVGQKTQQVQLETRMTQVLDDNQRKSLQIDELMAAIQLEKQKTKVLQENLGQKEGELLATEEKYRKCIDKAKEVIKTLDPRQQSLTDMTLLNNRIINEKAASTSAQAQGQSGPSVSRASGGVVGQDAMREGEEKLLASAFFKLGLACHRDAVDNRLALLTAGQSFLSRQRQAAPRKPLHPFRTK